MRSCQQNKKYNLQSRVKYSSDVTKKGLISPKYANSSCNSMPIKQTTDKKWAENLKSFGRRHRDDKKVHKEILNILNYQRNTSQNYNELSSLTLVRVAIIKKSTNGRVKLVQ